MILVMPIFRRKSIIVGYHLPWDSLWPCSCLVTFVLSHTRSVLTSALFCHHDIFNKFLIFGPWLDSSPFYGLCQAWRHNQEEDRFGDAFLTLNWRARFGIFSTLSGALFLILHYNSHTNANF